MSWVPLTHKELEALVREGLFSERHYREAKREIPAGEAGNKELAKDLASLAVDGGALYIGVEEPKPGRFNVCNTAVGQLPERLEQIARSRITPPLTMRTSVLPSEISGLGVVVVMVPPSPVGPHMVDHRYWGRGDKTKHALDDAEVLRLHERRKLWETTAEDLLEAEILRDPYGSPNPRSCIYLVAEPIGAPEDCLLLQVGQDPRKFLYNLVHQSACPPIARQFRPNLLETGIFARRAGGWGFHSGGLTSERSVASDANGDGLIDLELRENGGLRVFSGQGVYTHRKSESSQVFVMDIAAVGLFLHLLNIAKTVSESVEFLGSWSLGIAISNIRGAASSVFSQGFWVSLSLYPEDEYHRGTRATYEEIASGSSIVLNRVLGRFLRTLDSYEHERFMDYLS